MKLLSKLWRSLVDWIANTLDFFELLIESFAKYKVGRFILGSLLGIIPVLVYWSYAVFFQVNIPLVQGIAGSLILMLAFGVAAVYGKLERLFDSLNL